MYERALNAIYLEDTDRIPQIEYLYHTGFILKTSGMDPFQAPKEAQAKTYERLDLDLVWYNDQPYRPYDEAEAKGLSSFWRSSAWSELFPSVWRRDFPVQSVEDVLGYEPRKERGGKSVREVAEELRQRHEEAQRLYATQLVPGGYYCTTFMWPVMTFGLEWTLKAAVYDPPRFERLLNSFAEVSLRDFEAWSHCPIKAFISHDDICMTEGPILSPKWLRRYVFPWYKRLWRILHDRGIRVLFCSDGKIDAIVDDVAEAGADGFIIEPWSNLKSIVEKYGGEKVIIGNADLKVLTFKGVEDVAAEVKRCASTAGHQPGYFFNVTGSIPDNVPLENLEAYFHACRKYGKRQP